MKFARKEGLKVYLETTAPHLSTMLAGRLQRP